MKYAIIIKKAKKKRSLNIVKYGFSIKNIALVWKKEEYKERRKYICQTSTKCNECLWKIIAT